MPLTSALILECFISQLLKKESLEIHASSSSIFA